MHRHRLSLVEFEAFTETVGFSKVATIQRSESGGLLKFVSEMPPDDRRGWVYLWVTEQNETVEICYVGKAGHSLKRRFDQHAAGFRFSITGTKHAKKITELLDGGQFLTVFARHSDHEERFGETVSMCCVDELAFIAKFNPPWNKIDSILNT